MKRLFAFSLLSGLAVFILLGCRGLYVVSGDTVAPIQSAGPAFLQGVVHGGQQPVVGAFIQVYSAGTTGTGSAATPLLQRSVKSDQTGTFTLYRADLKDCQTGRQIYVTASGGSAGGNVNPGNVNTGIVMMAALGDCSLLGSSSMVSLNEVTTVAAVAALAPFLQSAANVGSSAFDSAALASAFRLAGTFADFRAGTSPGSGTPSGYSVPVSLVNTLADVLASCVNSDGTLALGSTVCNQLFALAPSGQTLPADTLTAAKNIAQNPKENTSALFQLIAAAAPFQPNLAGAPASFSIHLLAGQGLDVSSASIVFPATVVQTAASGKVLTVTNTSSSPVALSIPALSGMAAADFIIQNGCSLNLAGQTLAAQASCQITLRFQPSSVGLRQASLALGTAGQYTAAVGLEGTGLDASTLPSFQSTLSGPVIAAYDLTSAVQGQPVADVSGNPALAIPWPSANAPAVTPQGLVFNGATTSCLSLPAAVSGVKAVSVFNTKFGEDYLNGNIEIYRRSYILFAGTVNPGNVYSAEKFGTGIVGGSFFHPQISNDDYQASTLESGVGSHLFTFAPSTSAGDQMAIDDTYLTSFLRDRSSAASLQAPYFIGCEHPGEGIARSTISYVILWSAAPSDAQLKATWQALAPLAEAHGINNDWQLPATATDEAVACIGDSHTSGAGVNTYCSVENLPLLGAPYKFHVLATSAKFLSDLVPELPYELYRNVGLNAFRPITILDGGTNDLLSSSYAMETFYAQFQSAAAAAHAAGSRFLQQTFFSMCVADNGTSELLERETLNAWIRANWPSFADGISDVAANPTLGATNASCNDKVNFDESKFHLTNPGKTIEGQTPQSAILNLDGSTAASPTRLSGSGSIVSGQNYILAVCPADCTLTLPVAYLNAGWGFTVASQGPGTVAVAAATNDRIDGQANAISLRPGSHATFLSVANPDATVAGASWTTH